MLFRNAVRVSTATLGVVHTSLVARAPTFAVRTGATTRLLRLASPSFYNPPRSVAVRRYSSNNNTPRDAADTHGKTLWPPWQVSDLRPVERTAYESHGPDYLDYLNSREKKTSLSAARKRLLTEKRFTEQWGEHWYEIKVEAARRFDVVDAKVKAEIYERFIERCKQPGHERDLAQSKRRQELQDWQTIRGDERNKVAWQVADEWEARSVG